MLGPVDLKEESQSYFRRCVGSLTALLCLLLAQQVRAAVSRPHYRVRAAVSLHAPHIDGTVDVTFTNDSSRTIADAVFLLFPNRFSSPDPGVNDFNRPFLYPEEDFDPGRIEILAARDADRPASVFFDQAPPAFGEEGAGTFLKDCILHVPIAPLKPGEQRTIMLRFSTTAPYRFGSFGIFEQQLTLVGGWYPYLATLGSDGVWKTDAPPRLADFEAHLTVPPEIELLLNGMYFSQQPFVNAQLTGVHYLSLIAAAQLLQRDTEVDGTRIRLFRRPPRHASRISPEPDIPDIILATLRDVIAQRPPAVPKPRGDVVIVEAPLRLNLAAPGEGMIVLSDRAFEVHWLLRPFHEMQLAQTLYAELLRPVWSAREPDDDYGWVSEGFSRILARRYVAQARPGTRSTQEWIELFNIFAIVDRFETVPKIPFVEAFFERSRLSDPLRTEVMTFNSDLAPGRVILGKLREIVGEEKFDALVDRCVDGGMPFRTCANTAADADVSWIFEEWLQRYPALNYRFGRVELNRAANGSGGEEKPFHHQITIVRESSRAIMEPVTVRLHSLGGRAVDVRWDGKGDIALLPAQTSDRVWQTVIDPDRKLIEDRRDDNFRPLSPQVVLDTAEVEITSTEFGLSGLIVGRGRYDYRKDLAVAAFFTNRSVGFDAGARGHWGTPIDPTSYPHNLYAFYGFQDLDDGFVDKRRPMTRTPGQTAALGLRYDYTNVFSYDNPLHERSLRLYADWYDRGLGSDYNYVDWGFSVVGTQPLWSYRTIAAGELTNGFSETLGASVVPNQGLYSLGGSRSIRGIGAEDELGRNLLVMRAELRQDIYPELDLNLLDLLVLRRTQMRLFVDSGRVSGSAGEIYDVSGFAVGIGAGVSAIYDFMGFFPSQAYVAIATRADRRDKLDDVQVLFGTRQAF